MSAVQVPVPTARRVTLPRVLKSEWIKFASLRSSWTVLGLVLIGLVAVGALASLAIASHWSRLSVQDQLRFNPVDHSLRGVNLAQLFVCVLAVLMVSGEYATGMIRATMSVVPTRWPVLLAKAVVFVLAAAVASFIGALLAFALGQHFLGSHGVTFAAPHVWRAIIGVAGYLCLVGLLGMAIAWIVRSTAGAIASVIGLLLVVPGLGELLPSTWQPHVLPYLPSAAGSAFYSASPDPDALAAGTGLIILIAWIAVGMVVSVVLLRRRDV